MFEIFRIIPILIGGKMIYDGAKSIGLVPVNLLFASALVLKWKKDREFTGWQNVINNPTSNFFKVIDVGDGYKTVGWGLTHVHNDKYPADCKITHYGQVFTLDQIERMYAIVKTHFENVVKSYLKGLSVPQGVFDACVSVCYNTGSGLFKNQDGSDTNFYKRLKQGKIEDARLALTWWRSGGQVMRGLVARRMGEHAIWVGKTPKSHEYYLTVADQFQATFDKNLL